jgi:hypothetical protein
MYVLRATHAFSADGTNHPTKKREKACVMKRILFVVLLVWGFAGIAMAEPVTKPDLQTARSYVQKKLHVGRFPLPKITQNPEAFNRIMKTAHASSRGVAAYTPGQIYLRDSFYAPVDMPELIHEMVHQAQTSLNIRYPCLEAREQAAYAVENAYIKEANIDRPQLPDFITSRGKRISTAAGAPICTRSI